MSAAIQGNGYSSNTDHSHTRHQLTDIVILGAVGSFNRWPELMIVSDTPNKQMYPTSVGFTTLALAAQLPIGQASYDHFLSWSCLRSSLPAASLPILVNRA